MENKVEISYLIIMDINHRQAELFVKGSFKIVTNNYVLFKTSTVINNDLSSHYGRGYSFLQDKYTPKVLYIYGKVNYIEILIHMSITGICQDHFPHFQAWIDQFFYYDLNTNNIQFNKSLMLNVTIEALMKYSVSKNSMAFKEIDFCETLPTKNYMYNWLFFQCILSNFGEDAILSLFKEHGPYKISQLNIPHNKFNFLQGVPIVERSINNYKEALKLKSAILDNNWGGILYFNNDSLSFRICDNNGDYTAFTSPWHKADVILNQAYDYKIKSDNHD